MEKRYFNSIGKGVSLLGFGCMRFPLLNKDSQEIDYDKAKEMVDIAYKNGVNYFDTAYFYHDGLSESFIGKALSEYPRDSYYVATKLPLWGLKSQDEVHKIFDNQLSRLGVDYIDFYLMHSLSVENFETMKKIGAFEILKQKQKEGLIRHLGFSFHDAPECMEKVVAEYDWEFVQIQLNYIDWDTILASKLYDIAVKNNLPVIVMEPVRGGSLANLGEEANNLLFKANREASVASWAVRFAASLPGVMTVLSGMTTMEQVEDNIKTIANFNPLTDNEREIIAQATTIYNKSGAIPCTGCRYCMECPSGVDIPRIFNIYNHYRKNNDLRIVFDGNYCTLNEGEKAHNCVSCGLCSPKCPQFIDIPARLSEIAEFAAQED